MKLADITQQYDAMIEYGKKQLPSGEEYLGLVHAVEELSGVNKFLREYVFGWLINMLAKGPRMYGVLYSDKTLVIMGFKQKTFTASFEPEFSYSKAINTVKFKKGLGKYTLLTETQEGKKLKLTISSYGDAKKDLEMLSSLVKPEA